ncbi:reverse transcriptase domain, Reverse transcriptase zinc-binding domain protein [Artemisia annua]|uniref:Reverse transcriptase domain, Reverse transcriptase zinc-binding domain protein n=1 Tax=Artemisia annua TaxID=35608 RepID=A0A2U1QIK2_ARTAN|nr:reverse transcriptase domain, Reverse transcriptase zinc-binding domain protein [Artemisia annua]
MSRVLELSVVTALGSFTPSRASFARVLVEIDSSKALVDNVELWYESLGKILKLWVEYTWVPPRCEECKVYGHYLSECAKKVNTVSKVNKDGETVKPADVKQSNNNNGDKVDYGDEGWQTATRRNFRNTSNNYHQGQVGNYNVRRGGTSNRGGFNNRGNSNVSNVGVKDTSKSSEPINSGSVGHIDESMVANDKGEPVNKGKSKINEGGGSNSGNSNGGIAVGKKNDVRDKEVSGSKSVATSNRFDLLCEEGGSETVDPWNDVKVKVANACNTNVPIEESVLKGWNADMVRFYSVKWNNRTRKSESVKQHFDSEMKSLSSQIAQISRNLDKNSKLNAEMKLKKADLDDLSCIWAEVVSGISIKAANNSVWSVIQRLTFGAAVYYIWQERNFRIFQSNFRTEENVFKVIVDIVRHKLMGLKIKKSREAVKAAVIWKFSLHGINGDGSFVNNTGIDGIT